MKNEKFKNLVLEIHKVNKAWHSYQLSNSLLDNQNKYIEQVYLKRKNILQRQLEFEYGQMIEIYQDNITENPAVRIKDEYHFQYGNILYTDVCHKEKDKN